MAYLCRMCTCATTDMNASREHISIFAPTQPLMHACLSPRLSSTSAPPHPSPPVTLFSLTSASPAATCAMAGLSRAHGQ
eukprot:3210975-Rhodomonas_salina.1